jgi:hypothetical protein
MKLDAALKEMEGEAPEEEDDGLPFACAICRGPFNDPVETKCMHYFVSYYPCLRPFPAQQFWCIERLSLVVSAESISNKRRSRGSAVHAHCRTTPSRRDASSAISRHLGSSIQPRSLSKSSKSIDHRRQLVVRMTRRRRMMKMIFLPGKRRNAALLKVGKYQATHSQMAKSIKSLIFTMKAMLWRSEL